MTTTASAVENFRLTAALGYAKRGWHVIPLYEPAISPSGAPALCRCGRADCGSVGKHPRTKNGLKDATTDEATIRGWWEQWPAANLGVVTGAVSGLLVLDIDTHSSGAESFGELCDAYGQIEETVEARTGSGGSHLLFKHPGGVIGNSAGKLGRGLDTRGDGGYIVVAPSLHASGRRYEWLSEEGRPLQPVPLWMMGLLQPPRVDGRERVQAREAESRHWLGKALAKAQAGTRNDTGYWLACQLRDNGVSVREAEQTMADYAARCPGSDSAYTQSEALATCRSAYASPPRDPASRLRVDVQAVPKRPTEQAQPAVPSQAAAEELNAYLGRITSGEVYNVPLPWRLLTHLTNCLLPGSITTLCGDPGVGKTYWVLQCLRFWIDHGVKASVMFIEKDRRFHTQRLLAQLEGDGRWAVNFRWIADNKDEVDAAMKRHWESINFYGAHIDSSPRERLNLGLLRDWVGRKCAAGCRVLVIDPITAADGGDNRWRNDDDFMLGVEKVLNDYGTSLILVTHPKKGARPGIPNAHDTALGAAYHRFADTNIWIYRAAKPRKVLVQSPIGMAKMKLELFAQLHKTRNGVGGREIGLCFGNGLEFAEQGQIVKEAQGEEEDEVPV